MVLLVFLGLAGAFVLFFFVYHLRLIATGRTTYESMKLKKADRTASAVQRAECGEEPRRTKVGAIARMLSFGLLSGEQPRRRQRYSYDRGTVRNFLEVLWPCEVVRSRSKSE